MNVKEFWSKSSTSQKIIYSIYIIAFLIATCTHTRDLLCGGLFPYTTKPLWANIYWTTLTIADPLAILILLLSVRGGIVSYSLIIISDVLINLNFTISETGLFGIFNIFMLGQLLFLIILLLTWKNLSTFKEERKG